MKKYSAVKVIICMAILFIWLVISPVAFFGKFNCAYEKISPDGEFKVVAYNVLPATPYAAYQSFICNDIFVVLYDKNGRYLGQSSPFHFSELDGVFADAVFFPGDIPGEESFSINGVNDYVEGYTIPVNNKRWWSQFISAFH
ncbi:hypothetical protein KKZ45_00750 [Enterobacter bugandensis]|uniref:DUF6201 family protein n=1 Tax=Enterobacter bugandensis TaxID=881260 RepID=UPI001237BB73|nr:DUF6201 family protein [Enterobacter bugandensis]MBT2088781.1 hypothetical protein [Enterobacter bugandensis]MCK7087509.1 DUF6201 family protein [Enterobacter bugandensis]MCK7159064.1 DUF6201 family protein [Enterobacter bugandensis]